ncbi:type VII secretion protein EccE [Prauserella shujinwangii]|uniref:Type VII secretion protein EccE n=1 Tax=Prauserella shujinwangii TaxID=1453103 RepID=A0A2T0LX07_9PSEU|nr:type VII secretion protein EccE [Prauserella shujinwangii]PRX48554.1 type VII secretion protein EccE [Prauserella shujinwangii]
MDVLAPLVALVAAVASVRVRGGRLALWAVTWLGYRLRQHDDREPLHAVRVSSHGHGLGLAAVGDTWAAVVRLSDGHHAAVAAAVRVLRAVYRQTEVPLVSAQLVRWSGSGGPVCWVVVRYRAAEAPFAARLRGGGERGAQRATLAAASLLTDLLAAAGARGTVLTAEELSDDLLRALGAGDGIRGVETWRSWSDGGLAQACFRPARSPGPVPVFTATAPGAVFTAVSLTLRGAPSGTPREDLVVRFGLRPGESAERVAAGFGVPLVPLHGRHRPYLRRTLPLAL